MLLHDPRYEAHRDRGIETLTYIAGLVGITVEQLLAGYDYKPIEERAVEMARPGRPPKRASQAEQLLAALTFVSEVKATEMDYTEYVQFGDKYVTAFNGQVAAGYPIVEDLASCPHLDKLKIALLRCGKTLALAETPSGQLSLKGEKISVLVPCFTQTRPHMLPDANVAPVDDRIKEAFKVCGTLASERADEVICASLLLEANQCTGTNRAAMLQFWHGIDLPPHMVIPKVFADAIAKCPLKLVGFGLTWSEQLGAPSSITLWFENGAWLKTQCYNDRWPPIQHLLDVQTFPTDAPAGLFEAIEAVVHFNDDDDVYFRENSVQSHDSPEVGAQYEVPGLQGGKVFDGELIRQVAPWASKMDLTTFADRAFLFGGEEATPVRGVLMAKGPKSQS